MKKVFGYDKLTVRANIYLKYKLPKRLPTVRGNHIKLIAKNKKSQRVQVSET